MVATIEFRRFGFSGGSVLALCVGLLSGAPLVGCGAEQMAHRSESGLTVPALSGLRYETAEHVGTTASDGSFLYEPGETIIFSLGDVVLGEVTAQPRVSLLDLVPDAVLLTGAARSTTQFRTPGCAAACRA